MHAATAQGVKTSVLLHAAVRHLRPWTKMLWDFGSQVQGDPASLPKTDLEGNTLLALSGGNSVFSWCSGWSLAPGLVFRNRWWHRSLFWQYGTKSCHLQCFESTGLEPCVFHIYSVARVSNRLQLSHQGHLTQRGCLKAGVASDIQPSRALEIQN